MNIPSIITLSAFYCTLYAYIGIVAVIKNQLLIILSARSLYMFIYSLFTHVAILRREKSPCNLINIRFSIGTQVLSICTVNLVFLLCGAVDCRTSVFKQ